MTASGAARPRRWLWRGLILAAAIFGAMAMGVLLSGSGAESHVDPATATPPGSPNWALAAPSAADTTGEPTIEAPIWDASPEALIEAFDRVALAAPRTVRVDAGEDTLWRSYRQRSRIFRFPDYVSAKAVVVATPDGPRASLVVYSRSVYGYSDMGVNAARVNAWIGALESSLAPVR